MHIPDGFLQPRIWATADLVSGLALFYALRRTSQTLSERAIPLMGVLAAFVFAAQMINLPVAGGTSGHFLGGTLVGILLGPWLGLVVMSVVLIVQCFIFQDGGVAALGANLLTMGLIGSTFSAYFYQGLIRLVPDTKGRFWAAIVAAFVSIQLSAYACAALLAGSGVVPWKMSLVVIGGVHAVIGVLEGVVTATVLKSIARVRPDLIERTLS